MDRTVLWLVAGNLVLLAACNEDAVDRPSGTSAPDTDRSRAPDDVGPNDTRNSRNSPTDTIRTAETGDSESEFDGGGDVDRSDTGEDAFADATVDVADGGEGDAGADTAPSARSAAGVHPLSSLYKFDQPVTNLERLEQIAGQAEIVGLGQDKLYSLGFSRARVRLVKYMIEEMEFRLFALWGYWKPGRRTNEHLVQGKHSIRKALTSMFAWWRHGPMRRLLGWIRTWNENHPDDKVRFFGFDVTAPPHDGKTIRTVASEMNNDRLSKLSSEVDACIGARYDSMRAWRQNMPPKQIQNMSRSQFDSCKKVLSKLETWHQNHRMALERTLGKRRAMFFAVAIRALQASNRVYYHRGRALETSLAARYEGQADVFERLRSMYGENRRVVVFHHNDGLVRESRNLSTEYEKKTVTLSSFGSQLAKHHGDDYRAIGLFAETIRATPPRDSPTTWKASSPNAIETILGRFRERPLLVDVDEATGPGKTFAPGRAYEMGHEAHEGVPSVHWDGGILLKISRPIP